MACLLTVNRNRNAGIRIINMFTYKLKAWNQNEIRAGPIILGFITGFQIPKGGLGIRIPFL